MAKPQASSRLLLQSVEEMAWWPPLSWGKGLAALSHGRGGLHVIRRRHACGREADRKVQAECFHGAGVDGFAGRKIVSKLRHPSMLSLVRPRRAVKQRTPSHRRIRVRTTHFLPNKDVRSFSGSPLLSGFQTGAARLSFGSIQRQRVDTRRIQ